MPLKTKTTLLILLASTIMITLLVGVSLLSLRQFSLTTAQEHVLTSAEVVRVSLTEAMINGVIGQRESFLKRLAEVPGLESVRVVRGPEVIRQFGEGISLEQNMDQVEQEVLKSGKPYFNIIRESFSPLFRGTIPFVADSRGSPNCLQCHTVGNGSVLGVITITLSMDQLQRKALFTIVVMAIMVALFAGLAMFLIRRQITPLIDTAQGVQQVVERAGNGDFRGRISHSSNDEIGQIASGLNQLMGHFQESLGLLCRDVAKVLKYDTSRRTDLLATTTEMVEYLVEVAQFKQSIEEDHTKQEVYIRLTRLIHERFGFQEFSFYEAAANKNHMHVIAVDGEVDGQCRWCDQQILFQADSCRAQRTGHPIDAFESPHICGLFQSHEELPERQHYCLPIIHSGAVGNVLQLVCSREKWAELEKDLPYIRVYLREAAPMLEAKRLLDTLRESALRDPLTGLHNRRFLEEYVDTLVAVSRRKKQKVCIMMMDLDHFKQVNDTYGHEAGDNVLKSLAKALEQQLRASDLVIRFGGEEFMVILQETDGYSGLRVAEKVRMAVELLSMPVGGVVLHKTISIGVAFYAGEDHDEFWDVAKQADTALYQAKAAGRNRVVAYEANQTESL